MRFDPDEEELILSYSIDPDFRGRGLGQLIVDLGVQEARKRSDLKIRAVVKKNGTSIRIFEKLKFAATRQGEQQILFTLP